MPASTDLYFDPYDLDFRRDPYPTYRRLREEDPVHASPYGSWVLTRYSDCSLALTDPRFGTEAPETVREEREGASPPSLRILSETMLFRDPPDHTRLRGLVSQAFTPRAVDALLPRAVAIVDELLDAAGDRFDLITDLAHPLPVRVICELLDVPAADRERIRAWSADLAGVVDIALDLAVVARGAAAAEALVDYFEDLLAERVKSPGVDLLSALAHAEGDQLTHEEMLAVCVQLLFGGHETTQNLIGNGTLALLRHPEQLRRLRADPALLRSAVEEFLRYDGPGQLAGRWTKQDVMLGEVTIGAGEQVLCVLGAANRDPAVFADPDAVDVSRSPNKHLTFGAGVHFCLGAPLARMEAGIAFDALLRRFPSLELAADPEWRPTLALRGLAKLPLAT